MKKNDITLTLGFGALGVRGCRHLDRVRVVRYHCDEHRPDF